MDPERPLGKEGQTSVEAAEQPTQAEMQYAAEKNAFKTHMETSGAEIPSNFEHAGAYFDSLKEAQKQYTQARQEISDLKKTVVPKAPEPVAEIPSAQQQTEEYITNELRIPKPEPKPPEPAPDYTVSEDMYEKWGYEFATQGTLSDATQQEIKQKTGFSDRMVKDYIAGQKAKLREGFDRASGVVGGKDKLNTLFKWASSNLSNEDMENINLGLASPTYEVTLRGLNAMYQEQVTKEKQMEPERNPNLTQVAASQTGILPFTTQREFKEARSNPNFQIDASFREQVQQRMAITDWNRLPI